MALKSLTERLRLRAEQPAFHPNATQFTLGMDPRLFGLWRQSIDRSQSIFAIHNVSADEVWIAADSMNLIADQNWYDLLSGEMIYTDGAEIPFAPYQCRWITNRRI